MEIKHILHIFAWGNFQKLENLFRKLRILSTCLGKEPFQEPRNLLNKLEILECFEQRKIFTNQWILLQEIRDVKLVFTRETFCRKWQILYGVFFLGGGEGLFGWFPQEESENGYNLGGGWQFQESLCFQLQNDALFSLSLVCYYDWCDVLTSLTFSFIVSLPRKTKRQKNSCWQNKCMHSKL